jgi:hypothetical protein
MRKFSSIIHKKFVRQSVLVLEAASLCLLSSTAFAAIVTNTVNVAVPNTIDGIYLNLVTGASGTNGSTLTGWDFNPYNNNAGLTFYCPATPSGCIATGTPGMNAVAVKLMPGDVVDSTSTYNQFQTVGTNFRSNGVGYVGVKFVNETTGAANYGFIEIKTSVGSGTGLGFPATVLAYAYENTGASITVESIDAIFIDGFDGP